MATPEGNISFIQMLALDSSTVIVTWISDYYPSDSLQFRVLLYEGENIEDSSPVGNETVSEGSESSQTFADLIPGQTYTATVQACYAIYDACGDKTHGTNNTCVYLTMF